MLQTYFMINVPHRLYKKETIIVVIMAY